MKDIPGILSIANKILFNDKSKCRLRIGGFNDEQIKLLNKSNRLIDITIVDSHTDGTIVAKLHISDNIEDCQNEEWFEEYCHVCGKVKDKCHDDLSMVYDNPGFVCFECELARKAKEDRYKYADILMEFELKRLKEIKLMAVIQRFEICKNRDKHYGYNVDDYQLLDNDRNRPLTDFMTTEIAGEYLAIKEKLKK